jgi:signal transduction histidine kinase
VREGVGSRAAEKTEMSGTRLVGIWREQLIGQLTGGVAHDFNNILATVLGCLELMERRTGEPDRLLALIRRATDAVDRATTLTSAVVQFSRRQPRPVGPVDVNEVATTLMPLIHSALGRRVRLEAHLSDSLPAAHAEPTTLEAALLALCLAARRALPEGGQISLVTDLHHIDKKQLQVSVLAEGDQVSPSDLTLAESIATQLGTCVERSDTIEEGRWRLALMLPVSTGR